MILHLTKEIDGSQFILKWGWNYVDESENDWGTDTLIVDSFQLPVGEKVFR